MPLIAKKMAIIRWRMMAPACSIAPAESSPAARRRNDAGGDDNDDPQCPVKHHENCKHSNPRAASTVKIICASRA